jgi:hypothetical protein
MKFFLRISKFCDRISVRAGFFKYFSVVVSYDVKETCRFVEVKYGVKANEIVKIENNKPWYENTRKKSPPKSPPPKKEEGNEYRELAHEYFQIRQGYFEKATEAHSRGWGSVAQFYAEMVNLK